MKFIVSIGWDRKKQEEIRQDVELDEKQIRAIVETFIDNKDYPERQAWLKSIGS